MAIKHQLWDSVFVLLKHHKTGSFETRKKRTTELRRMAHDLVVEGGFKLPHIKGLKQKHIKFLNALWQQRGLKPATIKNKNSQLSWLCDVIGKRSMMPSNKELGVAKRSYIATENKAIHLDSIPFEKFSSPLMRVYCHLQYHLGLRREEAIKLKPHQADKGDVLELQGSWCKGGRPRQAPILTAEARAALEQAKQFANQTTGSLIPDGKNYIEQRKYYDNQMQKAGVNHPHGLRHAYAQNRYKALTGWECPVNGGLSYAQLTATQKAADRNARLQISGSLGHSRLQIVASYLG